MDDALSKLNENFLSCNICTDIFKDPCTIGCQHTFCKVCLARYTKTRREAISAKSIQCPNCLQMTKVPRPREPVEQWSQQFKPSFLIQGLLDTFTSQGSSDHVKHRCFTCQQIGKTTQARSVCEDCDILVCEACATIHKATPSSSDHVISPLGAGSTPQLKKRKVMCKEHNCLVEFCCKDCQKTVCQKCCIVYHRKCHSVVTLESMIPEMKQVLQQNSDQINSHIQQAGNTLQSRRSQVEEITQHKSSLQSEIRQVSQQIIDLIRRKEKTLLDELDTLTEKQTGQLRSQIKSGEIDLQTHQQYLEFTKQVLQSNSPIDMYEMYMLCQSGEVTAEIQRHEIQEDRAKKVSFEKDLDEDQLDQSLQLGHLKYVEDTPNLQDTKVSTQKTIPKLLSTVSTWITAPKLLSTVSTGITAPKLLSTVSTGITAPKLLSTVSTGITAPKLLSTVSTGITAPKLLSTVSTGITAPKLLSTVSTGITATKLLPTVSTITKDDTNRQYLTDIEVLNIGGKDTLVITDLTNYSVKSCYTKGGKPHCTSLKLNEAPNRLTKIDQDRVAVSHTSHNSIELIKLTPDPVLVSSIEPKKQYRCLSALSDTTLAAGGEDPPSIDVLDLSGRVLRSVITPSTDQQLIQRPYYMCTTRQGHIVVTDGSSGSVYCVTQQGEVVYTYKLRGEGVTTTDTGSVIVADCSNSKIVQLTETGQYVRDLLTGQDGIAVPWGVCVHRNKLYVTEPLKDHIKIFQL